MYTMKVKHLLRGLFGLWLVALCAAVQAQSTGAISGHVTDATGEFTFPDAEVRIEGQRRREVTGRDGSFRFNNVPEGQYELVSEYGGAMPERVAVTVIAGETAEVSIRIGGGSEQDNANQLKGLLIDSQAAGQAAAINRRRRAPSVIDVLSSDSVGNFPDQNVAEALQRAPGLSVQRDQGEGRFVVIRGIDPSFNSTTINGMRIPGPEADSRAVNLDAISSDLVESVEITKAITPDMDGDAVGGNIEVKTLTAFDLGGRSGSVTVGGSYNTTNEETSPDISASYTDLFSIGDGEDNLGIAFAVSQFDRDTVSDGIEGAPWEMTETPEGNEVNALLEGEQRDYVLTRKRTSVALNFDYRPTDTDEYYLRTMYSEFDDAETKEENIFKFEEGDIEGLDADSGEFVGAEYEKAHSDSNKIVEITSYSLGGKNERNNWTFDYNLGYATAGEAGDLEITGETLAEDVAMGYDKSGDAQQPLLYVIGDQGSNASDFILESAEGESVFNEERELAVAFNAQRDVMFGEVPGFIKFGAKTRQREKENNIDISIYEDFGDTYSIADFAQDSPVDYPPRGDFGPAVDRDKYRDFFYGNRDNFELNAEDSLIDSAAEDYDIEEDINAAYVMAQAEFKRLTVIGGVRVEETDYAARGTQVTIDENVNDGEPQLNAFSDSKSYSHVLPSLHLNYALQDNMAVRAALTSTIARPGFEAAGPWQIIEIEGSGDDIERVAETGNPDLEPLESTNFDLRWEYYPTGVSLMSAGFFYKDISNYFLTANVAGEAPFEAFDEVTQTINGGDAELYGIELAYIRQFDFLPGPWDGLLLDASYTFTDSESDLPERDSGIPLPGQSDHIASFALGYEKHGFNIRVAAAYRSEFFEETDDASDPMFDRYQDNHLQVDITSKYRINDMAQVYLNLVNINDEPLYAYWGSSEFNSQYEEYGPTIEAGVRLDF
ncbi:TonB-dependent receptor [Marinimicrobium koreense]|jgi:TonB-dependent receptor|uniref:TonB-dependent receptor n=1 Tax=Marinimicrobium koreense TaxID=306545 RepID=A0A3N1NY23_9GAMM|nr:TonB-dependent receptor [Marinimicrobium koreense]ROQ21083.1 TonB-dependent receptor [Marinimicrobium koreense]